MIADQARLDGLFPVCPVVSKLIASGHSPPVVTSDTGTAKSTHI